jgi:hypothetical protein
LWAYKKKFRQGTRATIVALLWTLFTESLRQLEFQFFNNITFIHNTLYFLLSTHLDHQSKIRRSCRHCLYIGFGIVWKCHCWNCLRDNRHLVLEGILDSMNFLIRYLVDMSNRFGRKCDMGSSRNIFPNNRYYIDPRNMFICCCKINYFNFWIFN